MASVLEVGAKLSSRPHLQWVSILKQGTLGHSYPELVLVVNLLQEQLVVQMSHDG